MAPCWMLSLAVAVVAVAAVAALIFFDGPYSLSDELTAGLMTNLLARCAECCKLRLMPLYDIHSPDGVINNALMPLGNMLCTNYIILFLMLSWSPNSRSEFKY
eukprot:5773095-Amphidinium_carterae.1